MTLIWIRNILYAWNLLNINWASVETCQFSRNAIYTHLLYSCFIYRHVQTVFQYQNKLYISPIIGLAMFLFLEPELLIFLFSEINKQVYRVTITNTFIKLYNLNDIYMRFLVSISLSLSFSLCLIHRDSECKEEAATYFLLLVFLLLYSSFVCSLFIYSFHFPQKLFRVAISRYLVRIRWGSERLCPVVFLVYIHIN